MIRRIGRATKGRLSCHHRGSTARLNPGSALIIVLPDILTRLHTDFITIMRVLLGYLLIPTAVVPVVGRLADMFGRKNLCNAGFAIFTLGSLLCAVYRWEQGSLAASHLLMVSP